MDKVIANFYKYKDESHLFDGLADDTLDYYGSVAMASSNELLILNFEKGTIKKIMRERAGKKNTYSYINYIKGFPTEKTITGDFNGDGIKDSLTVANDKLLRLSEQQGFFDGFNFMFSDKKIPKLRVNGNLDYTIKNEGDLDGDGADEIGFLYGWNTSGCRTYEVYTLKRNKWRVFVGLSSTVDMRRTGIIPIEKDPKQEGVILIRYSVDGSACCCTPYVVEECLKIN